LIGRCLAFSFVGAASHVSVHQEHQKHEDQNGDAEHGEEFLVVPLVNVFVFFFAFG
jgi:hypothetical protein